MENITIRWQRIAQICPQIANFDHQELDRLRRLSPRQGSRFSRTRTYLRQVLGTYLQTHPQSVKIAYTDSGKPFVVNNPVYFNLSHSGDLIVVALHDRYCLGIDLEQIKPRPFAHLIRRYFSLGEQQWFSRLNPADLGEQFYRSWVIKEAYSKLLEVRLPHTLAEFNTIPLLTGKPAPQAITIAEIPAPIGYKCALAYRTLQLEG